MLNQLIAFITTKATTDVDSSTQQAAARTSWLDRTRQVVPHQGAGGAGRSQARHSP